MLKLTAIETSDISRIIDFYNNEEIHDQMILGYLLPVNEYNMKEYIEHWLKDSNQKHYKIVYNQENVGFAQIYDISYTNRKAKLGIMIDQAFQNQGIGKKVLARLADICFDHINLHKVEAEALDYNKRPIQMFNSLGFVHEGSLRESVYKNGKYHDICLYGLLKKERQAQQ